MSRARTHFGLANVDRSLDSGGLTKNAFFAIATALLLLFSTLASADERSARASMSNPANPLVALFTTKGAVYFELYRARAPRNVERTLALIEGNYAFEGSVLQPRYYDQTPIRSSTTDYHVLFGQAELARYGLRPTPLQEEIDAAALGLAEQPLFGADSRLAPRLGIKNRAQFDEQILAPLYRSLGIAEADEVAARAASLWAQLKQQSVADALRRQGHRFTAGLGTQTITAGTLVLLSHPAGTASPIMLIALRDSPWLDGRVTPIGHIVEGIENAEQLAAPATGAEPDKIYSMRVLAPAP